MDTELALKVPDVVPEQTVYRLVSASLSTPSPLPDRSYLYVVIVSTSHQKSLEARKGRYLWP